MQSQIYFVILTINNSLLSRTTGSSLLITEKFVLKIMKPATHTQ